jgi:hypothetical protein
MGTSEVLRIITYFLINTIFEISLQSIDYINMNFKLFLDFYHNFIHVNRNNSSKFTKLEPKGTMLTHTVLHLNILTLWLNSFVKTLIDYTIV